ncbi:protein BOLA2 [Iris pallida]|uniref:Protein BOLA2 n=1 Tax=Iris pallida TaxID=29817 RepID=A0AAX6F3Y8_IRIPA|nr:protein BOLA2 [Iris pallida]
MLHGTLLSALHKVLVAVTISAVLECQNFGSPVCACIGLSKFCQKI